MTAKTCGKVTPSFAVSITSTSVVLGIATLGRPEACPGCDCATDAIGSIARNKVIMNFIGSPQFGWLWSVLVIRVLSYSNRTKKLPSSEGPYKKGPRLHQDLLALFRGRKDPGHHQHSRHAGK